MKIAYFDCFNGAGGDMLVAALIDAGADVDGLRRVFDSLGVEGYRLSIERVRKQGLASVRFHVELDPEQDQPHRHLKHIEAILHRASLPQRVRENAIRVFTRLAEAEAAVHGTTIDRVHFHEVGAVDALLDIVGVIAALDLLGVERVVCSPVPAGSGTVSCEHGVLPVPAPATAELLEGFPLAASPEPGELITPTAAALLTTLAGEFGPIPSMTLRAVGYGAGSREGQTRPNVVRVLLGDADAVGDVDEVTLLETNLDDAAPSVIGYCIERMFQAGALDVFTVPIQMKKSRTAVMLCVMCEHGRVEAMIRILFSETPTFGIRRRRVERVKLLRRHETVATPFGEIRIKVGAWGDIMRAQPEFEDCKAAAQRHNVPLHEVLRVAVEAWNTKRTRA